MRSPHLAATLALIISGCIAPTPLAAQKGVNLGQLTKLAKDRAAKLRPALEEKLKPYLEILSASYDDNWATINQKVTEIVSLGDSIIPLLLEKLEPRRESPRSRNLAANCSRALALLQPASFVDSLIEIIQGENYTGIGLAISLLGKTANERAGEALTQLLDGLDVSHRRYAVRALTDLGHKGAVLKIAKGLPYSARADDRAAIRYLMTISAREVVPEVRRALGEVKRIPDIMRYIRLLGACAHNDAATAHQLLAYFDHEKLDVTSWTDIAKILAVVAPKGDEATIERLRMIVRNPSPGTLELQAAITLRTLGNRDGPKTLEKTLHRLTQASRSRRDYLNWSNYGEFLLEFGEYKRAVQIFKEALKKTASLSIQSSIWIHIARAQARRKPVRAKEVRNALRDSQASYAKLMQEAADDPALAAAMLLPIVKTFMDSFPN